MQIIRSASAGTMESSDAYVEIEPGNGGITLELESVVYQQFGGSIERSVRQVLAEHQVENACVRVMDRGALECVLCARVEAAIKRGGEEA